MAGCWCLSAEAPKALWSSRGLGGWQGQSFPAGSWLSWLRWVGYGRWLEQESLTKVCNMYIHIHGIHVIRCDCVCAHVAMMLMRMVMRCGIWWWCLLLLLFLLYIHCYFLPQACECLPLFDTDSYDAYNIYIYPKSYVLSDVRKLSGWDGCPMGGLPQFTAQHCQVISSQSSLWIGFFRAQQVTRQVSNLINSLAIR